MNQDPAMIWSRCARLGRVLLPMVDQEAGRQAERHENLRIWDIDTAVGERTVAVFAALAAHAVAVDAAVSAAGFEAMPLRAVAEAATGKRDIELLAGLPETFTDSRDELAVKRFRLSAYEGGQASRQLFQLSREVRHSLLVLADRPVNACPTCGDVLRRPQKQACRTDHTSLRSSGCHVWQQRHMEPASYAADGQRAPDELPRGTTVDSLPGAGDRHESGIG
ncbi:hypothetical protein [Streptomyces sp. NPDC091879]|uniref:hypothetical protein n=1 Tax=Streptomyces sp. NPDC091879 TaxID=3366006 RepID=UPI003808F4E1